MNKYTKIRMFKYKIANRLRLLEGEEFASEVDKIIEEIQKKKLDKFGDFKQFMIELINLKEEAIFKPKSKPKQYDAFEIPPSGCGRITLFGLSNVGKSTLLNAVTNTNVKVGNYLHTTTIGQAGECEYEDISFQIVDIPGFLDFKDEWSINKQILRVTRTSDAIVLVIDLSMDIDRQITYLSSQLEKAQLFFEGESSYKIAIIATKGDLPGTKETFQELLKKSKWDVYPVAYNTPKSYENLKKSLFNLLEIIRVYTKPPGEKPDLSKPFVIPNGATVQDLVEKIHSSFIEKFRYARIWGTSCEFEGQQVGLDHFLADKDIIEVIVKK